MGYDASPRHGVLVPLDQVFAVIPKDCHAACAQRLREAVRSDDTWWGDAATSYEWASSLAAFAQANHHDQEFLENACRLIKSVLLPVQDEPGEFSCGVGEEFCDVLNKLWIEPQPSGLPAPLGWPRIQDIRVFYNMRMSGSDYCEPNRHYVAFSAEESFRSTLTACGMKLAEALKQSDLRVDHWVVHSF